MALLSSGTMSIGGSTTGRSINLELGRSAGATSSLGETALRTLAGVSSGAISMDDFYGASDTLDEQTVTVGTRFIYYQTWFGYWSQISIGSISDGTSNLYSGASIIGVHHSSSNRLYFYVSGNRANSGWTSMTVGSTTVQRTSATYTNNTTWVGWYWDSISNPFGSSGSNTTVTWA